jgi:uncharacterized protein
LQPQRLDARRDTARGRARDVNAGREATLAKEDRGFASMDRSKQKEIASKGGKAAHQKGTAHEWTSEEAREAGRKGGMASHRRRQETSSDGGEAMVAISNDSQESRSSQSREESGPEPMDSERMRGGDNGDDMR